jgi:nitrogen fixation NifU-like protein
LSNKYNSYKVDYKIDIWDKVCYHKLAERSSLMASYSERVIDYFSNPRHAGIIADADGIGRQQASSCNDINELFIQVRDDKIIDARFRAFGCVAAIACASFVAEWVRGRSLAEADALTAEELMEALGGLPPGKEHGASLAIEALRNALTNYRARHPGKLTSP